MTSITCAIPDDRVLKLTQTAARLQVTPEEPLRISLEEILPPPEEAVQRAARYLIETNSERNRWLA